MRPLLQKLNTDDHYIINKIIEVTIHYSYRFTVKEINTDQSQNYRNYLNEHRSARFLPFRRGAHLSRGAH